MDYQAGSAVLDSLLTPDDRVYLMFRYPRGGCAPIALCVVTGESAQSVESAMAPPMLAYLTTSKGGMLARHIQYVPDTLARLGWQCHVVKKRYASSIALSLTRRYQDVAVLVWSEGHVHACKRGHIYDHWAVGSKKFQTRRAALRAYRNCRFMLIARERQELVGAAVWLEGKK